MNRKLKIKIALILVTLVFAAVALAMVKAVKFPQIAMPSGTAVEVPIRGDKPIYFTALTVTFPDNYVTNTLTVWYTRGGVSNSLFTGTWSNEASATWWPPNRRHFFNTDTVFARNSMARAATLDVAAEIAEY